MGVILARMVAIRPAATSTLRMVMRTPGFPGLRTMLMFGSDRQPEADVVRAVILCETASGDEASALVRVFILAAACSAAIIFAPQLELGKGLISSSIAISAYGEDWPCNCCFGRVSFSSCTRFWPSGSARPRSIACPGSVEVGVDRRFRHRAGTVQRDTAAHHPTGAAVIICLAAAFAVAFALFLSKSLVWFKAPPEQHWWQAMLDYGIDWRTPIFSFGANALYNFGVQTPLKGQLLPMEGTAHLFPVQFRIAVTVTLCFLSTTVLFWCIGAVVGLKPTYRIVLAGSLALITTIPVGLNYVLWFLPPGFFTYQFTFAMWWGEAPVLLDDGSPVPAYRTAELADEESVRRRGLCRRRVCGRPLLSRRCHLLRPSPLCLLSRIGPDMREPNGILVEGECECHACRGHGDRAGRPFLTNLYGYAFGAYFFEFSPERPASFDGTSVAITSIYYLKDPRGLFSFLIAFGAMATAA